MHRVTLENQGSTKKTLKLFSFVEFCLWNAHDDTTNYQRNFSTGEVEVDGSTVYHKTEYRERRNHYAFYHVNQKVAGFDTDREAFFGLYNGMGEPDAVAAGKSTNSVASGWSPIASHSLEVTLAPGEKRSFVFVLGYIENPVEEKWEKPGVINKKRAKSVIEAFSTDAQVEAALGALRQHWSGLLSNYTVESKDDKLNRMVNIWNPYQCMVTFNMSRSASYFETGIGRGMGFRDSNQDLLGFVHLVPERARERIIDIASTQFADGSAYHQYQPLTKRGNNDIGSGFNDDPLWLILGTAAYIKETGDYSHPRRDRPLRQRSQEHRHAVRAPETLVLSRDREPRSSRLAADRASRLERLPQPELLLGYARRVLPDHRQQDRPHRRVDLHRGHVRLHRARVRRSRREVGQEGTRPRRLASTSREWKTTVEKHGYDGEWFLRAYDYYGNKVGSHENKEGKIYIEPQGFCVMAGIGKKNGLAQKALDSVKERLDTPYGIVLVNPAYTEYHVELGEISSYPPGYKENAGIFCHNNPWIMIAETVLGRGDRAFEYYKKIAPAYIEDKSEIHRTEPYVYSQMIAGKDAARHGEAKNSWLTGTAAWNYVAIAHYMLGVRPEYDGLLVQPCIDKELASFTVHRKCRGADYLIQVKNSGKGGPCQAHGQRQGHHRERGALCEGG